MLKLPIYLDHNATTPCDPKVLESMLPFFTIYYGNASNQNHSFGWQAAEAVELARAQVADLINAETKEIIFTSGATESVNLAIKGVFETYASKGNHIITCSIEHKAVLDSCQHLEKQGAEISYLPVDKHGLIDLQQLESAIKPTTILIAIMYASNEIGTIMPIKEIGRVAKKHGVLFFSDATQAVGKISVDVINDDIDLLAMSAHKIYGPKGAAALYIRRKNPRVKLSPQMDGGGQENGLRSGTLNVPGIVGLGKACELCGKEMKSEAVRLGKWRDQLENGLLNMPDVFINGNSASRLPHLSNISFQYVDGNNLMARLSKAIALSSGSACSAATMEPSYVLKAIGLSDDLAYSTLRFGLGRNTTEEEIEFVIHTVRETVNSLRKENPVIK